MSRYRQALVAKHDEVQAKKAEQEKLKKKHGIKNPSVVVVEKKAAATMLRGVQSLVRGIAAILLISLAAVGLISLIYPQIRNELFTVIGSIQNEIVRFIGG